MWNKSVWTEAQNAMLAASAKAPQVIPPRAWNPQQPHVSPPQSYLDWYWDGKDEGQQASSSQQDVLIIETILY